MAVSLLTQDDHVDDDDDRSHNDYYELQFPSQVSLHYILWQYGLWSFQTGITKNRKIFAEESTYPKEIIEILVLD